MEARAISTLNHPHICSLFEVGPNYLVMEFIEGSTLAAEIKKGPLTPDLVARYGAQIASAWLRCSRSESYNRDLKPANFTVTLHGINMLDFGLAKMLHQAIRACQSISDSSSSNADASSNSRWRAASHNEFLNGLAT